MTAPGLCLAWGSGFVSIFLMGFQSRNVVAGRYMASCVTSCAIAVAQAFLWHAAAKLQPMLFAAVFGTAGPAAICAAIWVSRRMFKTGLENS